MTISNTTLYELVAKELGIIDGNQALAADDAARIAEKATYARAWLLEDGKVYWVDGSIPEAVALPLAMIIAERCAPQYSRGPQSEYPYTDGATGYRLLCENVSKRSANEAVVSQYF